MHRVTHIFLNWRRAEQLAGIVKAAMEQETPSHVVVIDNASTDPDYRYRGEADTLIEADNRNACWERWIHAAHCTTEYVVAHDDDLCYTTPYTLGTGIAWLDQNPDVDAIGAYGVRDAHQYWKTQTTKHEPVDILKGRYIIARTDRIRSVDPEPDRFCDDIKISAHLASKMVMPALYQGTRNLTEGEESLWRRPDWRELRQTTADRYFTSAQVKIQG